MAYLLKTGLALAVVISALTIARGEVKNAVTASVEPFPLGQVRLLDGPFKQAMELDKNYLLSLDPDRLLSWFRKEAGLQPKAPVCAPPKSP